MPSNALSSLVLLSSATTVKSDDPCSYRGYCVVIYLAPWCHHCQTLVPHLKIMRDKWNSTTSPGVKIIVGGDTTEKMEAMAKTIGLPVYIDKNNVYKMSLNINFTPYWVVLDHNGLIIKELNNAVDWVNNEINKK